MTNRKSQIQELARIAYDSIESAERQNGGSFLRVKDDAPDWVTDLIRDAAHDRAHVLPSDERYSIAADALESIADGATPDDWDSIEGDCYTSDLIAWLSEPGAIDACDDVLAEGLGLESLTAIIQYAQGRQKEAIRQSIYDWLESADVEVEAEAE